jgi:hypothetical protein
MDKKSYELQAISGLALWAAGIQTAIFWLVSRSGLGADKFQVTFCS